MVEGQMERSQNWCDLGARQETGGEPKELKKEDEKEQEKEEDLKVNRSMCGTCYVSITILSSLHVLIHLTVMATYEFFTIILPVL